MSGIVKELELKELKKQKEKIKKEFQLKECTNCGRDNRIGRIEDWDEAEIESWLEECNEFKPCHECGELICGECLGMATCQRCYEDFCNRHLEQCPECLENFCENCIKIHLKDKTNISEQLKKFKEDITILPENTQEIILKHLSRKWFTPEDN